MSDGNPKTVNRRPDKMPSVPQNPCQSPRHSIYDRANQGAYLFPPWANSGMQSRDSLRDSPEMHCKIRVALARCARLSKNKVQRCARENAGLKNCHMLLSLRQPLWCLRSYCCSKLGQREPKMPIGRALRREIGSLSTPVFEMQTATGREHFKCQDSSLSQIFILTISNEEKILSNVNVVV